MITIWRGLSDALANFTPFSLKKYSINTIGIAIEAALRKVQLSSFKW